MESILIICFAVSFLITLFITPYWANYARKANLAVRDMNKANKPIVPTAGGVPVIAGFLFGLLFYIALKTFIFKNLTNATAVNLFAILCVILISCSIGFLDDVLGRISLRKSHRIILCLIAAIPLVALNSGKSMMSIPFIGMVDFGVIYPLILIPLGVSGAANGFDMIGGYNGLQTGLGIIILSALGILTWMHGSGWLAVVCFCMVFALIAFLMFNKYPAKVLDGNTLSYIVGALIACIAIVGNTEKAALILFIPYFIELLLKARGGMRKESFAVPNKDGSLDVPYQKIYGLEHAAIALLKKIKPSHKVHEKDVTSSLIFLEVIFAIAVLI